MSSFARLTVASAILLAALGMFGGCSSVRLPAIDPSGDRFFLPAGNYTTLNSPENCSGCGVLPEPAFTRPPVPPRCDSPLAMLGPPGQRDSSCLNLHPARQGELTVIPSMVVAPVTSEVIVVGGICGSNGRYLPGRKLEWLLAQESVGNFVEVGDGPNASCTRLISDSGKQSANYATSTTARHPQRIDRGTATTVDDISVSKGQSWITITSPTEGTSYITCWAPAAEGWDKRRKTTKIHWLDAAWTLPPNATALSGQEHELLVTVQKGTTGHPVSGWQVEYEILPGSVPAGFSPTLSTKARVTTDENGRASIRIRQPDDQVGPGVSNVQVTLVRPENELGTKERLTVASSVSSITWSSPALTLRAAGPEVSGRGGQLVYQVDVSNPGDLPAENVQIAIVRPDAVELVSSTPNPTAYGAQWTWNLGTLPPRSAPVRISVVGRAIGGGTARTCFIAAASNVNRQIEACVETRIETPCLGMRFENEPTRVQVGEVANYRMVITNECQQVLTNVQVEADFDPGFSLGQETSPVGLPPFDLQFGESRALDLPLTVIAAGNHCLRLAITADGGHTLRAQTCLVAEQSPQKAMDISINGPDMIRQGVAVPFVVQIKNTGNLPLESLEFHARFSPEVAPINSNIRLNWVNQELVGQLSALEPQASTLVNLLVEGITPTDQAAFEVWAVSGNMATETKVAALQVMPQQLEMGPPPNVPVPGEAEPMMNGPDVRVPSTTRSNRLVLSLTKLTDPVDLGDQGGLLIGLINDRDDLDQNVELMVVLPPGLEYLGGRDTDSLRLAPDADNPRVLRARRREMRPGDELTATLRVNPIRVGDQTVKVTAISAASSAPVNEEATIRVNP